MIAQIQDLLNLGVFFEKTKDQKISFKTSYKLVKLAKEAEQAQQFYNDKLREIVMTYSEKDENGNPIPTTDGQGIKIQEGKINDCYNEIEELKHTEISIPDYLFTLEEFDNVELTPIETNAIVPFIKE